MMKKKKREQMAPLHKHLPQDGQAPNRPLKIWEEGYKNSNSTANLEWSPQG
jgi:hypothetical protein